MSVLLAHSKNGNMLKIEDKTNPKGYVWYFLAANVVGFAKTIKDGANIDFKFEEKEGQDTITYITVEGATKQNTASPATTIPPSGSFEKKIYGKSPEEQEAIKRMSIMATATQAISRAFQGQVDFETLATQIEQMYDRLMNKVNS